MECIELCRVCIKCDPTIQRSGASIFDKTEDVFIYERLNTLCDVDIKPEDGLPDRICVECLLELHNAARFKHKCESSNKVLLSAFNTNSESAIKEEAIEDVKLDEDQHTEHEFLDEEELELQEPHSPPNDDVKHEYEELQQEQSSQPTQQPTTEKPSRAIDLKLECHDCGGLFKSKCKLKVHWKREHLKQYLTCDKCKRVFKTFKTLNYHKEKESSYCNTTYKIFTIEGSGRFRKYFCKQCDYTTSRNSVAFKHAVKHTGEKRFICNLCHKSFTQTSGLHYHMECFHKIYKKEAKCTICGKFIQGLRKLNIHMRRHAKNPVSCEICFKTINKSSLKCHMKRHLAKKGHACEVCGKEFAARCNLRNHIKRIHERKADLMCPKCGFKHFNLREINSHISRHTGDNVPCLVCGRFFKNNEFLASHMDRHNNKHFKCSECDKVYLGKRFFIRHLNEVHKIV